jgi:hypothetical protein
MPAHPRSSPHCGNAPDIRRESPDYPIYKLFRERLPGFSRLA